MEREFYLNEVRSHPWHNFPWIEGSEPPREWISEAWDLCEIQETHAAEMARQVNKNGGLAHGPIYLALLSECLTTTQIVELYITIRRDTPYREDEFRPEFEEAFSRHAAHLPPPLTREQVMDAMGIDEAEARHLLDGEPFYG